MQRLQPVILRASRFYVALTLMVMVSLPTPSTAAPLPSTAAIDDTRLCTPVTIHRNRISIGELLEDLQELTGVPLSVSRPSFGAGDEIIFISVRDLPLIDALNSLWSLVSYKRGVWHWTKYEEATGFRYVLVKPRAAQLLPYSLVRKAIAGYEKHCKSEINNSHGSGAELEKLGVPEDGKVIKGSAEVRRRAGIEIFSRLPLADREAVLRGEKSITAKVDDLGPSAKRFVASVYAGMVPPESRESVPVPDTLEFALRPPVPGGIYPLMVIGLGRLGAYGYLGGRLATLSFAAEMRKDWMHPGDQDASELEKVVATEPELAKSIDERESALERRFTELAAGIPVSVIARLPTGIQRGPDPGSPSGVPLSKFLTRVNENPFFLQYKWRKRVLLVDHLGWFLRVGTRAAPPIEAVKAIRDRIAAGRGVLTADDMVFAASSLTEHQLISLADELPVLRNVAYWRPVFAYLQGSSKLLERASSDQGISAFQALPSLSAVGGGVFDRVLMNGVVKTFRLRIINETGARPSTECRIELLNHRGHVVAMGGFFQKPKDTKQ